MKKNGDRVEDLTIIKKILWALHPKFDYIVIAIKQSKNLSEIIIDELQGILKAHE